MKEDIYDVVVVGGGPAGLTAALYLARACYRVLVIEKEQFGGQITITDEIVNYPGVAKTSGKALTEQMRRQAEAFGAEFLLAGVKEIQTEGDIRKIVTDKGVRSCFGILIATGAHPRTIGFPGETAFRGRGVAYCATCDGEFFTGKEVFVVGGGFAAAEESVFLTRYAKHVTILVREEDFTCAAATAKPAREHPNITVLTNTEVVEVAGDTALRSIRYRNSKTGEETTYQTEDTFGVFVFAGYAPETDLVKGLVTLDPGGYVVTDRNQKTNLDGVYAAGDVCQKNLRQVVTAVGDGAAAATELEKYAARMQKQTGILPRKPIPQESASVAADVPEPAKPAGGLFSAEIMAQLQTVFTRMEQPLTLRLSLNDSPASSELKAYMEEMAKHTDKLSVVTAPTPKEDAPVVEVLRQDGTPSGLAFHGVPGGHEFTSFILGLYNVAGPGQPMDEAVREAALQLDRRIALQIFVSLSCTMCPDLVIAAQRLAALNENVTAEVYDLNHFPALKEQYHVMSVPCLVVNHGEIVTFGKKNMAELLEILA